MSVKNNIFRAGIIPYFVDNGIIRYNFMKPSDPAYGGPDWQMAKGRVEDDEGNLSTALREGSEELGLKESNIISVIELGSYLGRTSVFICEVSSMTDFNPFHYETGDVVWLTLAEFEQIGRTIHLPIVRDAERYITAGFVDT